MDNRVNSGKAKAAKMTEQERHEMAMKMVEARKMKAKLPKVAYDGELNLGGVELEVAVLNDDTRVITLSGVFKALGRPSRGNSRLIGIPTFMDAANLQPFVNQKLKDVITKIDYVAKNGSIKSGYNATILPLVCDLYLTAREAGAITQKAQLETAHKAEILVRVLAQTGIIALVDEATGYQDNRAKDALAKIFEAFVAKELQPWIKTFPLEYYKQLCRLYEVPFPPLKNNKFPQFFGHVTNNAVYTRLAPEILPELKRMAKKEAKRAKLHQFLTSDRGHPKLREHLASVITLMKLSKDKEHFFELLDQVHPKLNETLPLPFENQ